MAQCDANLVEVKLSPFSFDCKVKNIHWPNSIRLDVLVSHVSLPPPTPLPYFFPPWLSL